MKIKKIMAKMLCGALILSNLTMANASNIIIDESSLESEEYINENYINDAGIMPISDTEENTNTQSSTEEIKVTYMQVSDYSVAIPKTITLNKAKQGTYSIKVTGNIDTIQQVHVEPVDSVTSADGINFYMKDTAGKKADVLATVTQSKFYWDSEEAANGYEETNNVISAPRLTSGSWEGIFHIKISLESKAHEHNYVDDICTICGEINPDHAHNYQDGKCSVCGKIDSNHSHSYVDHVCTICGEIDPSHTHNYVDGVCTICNKQYLEAGLYDSNDNLIVSWSESGINNTCSNAATIIKGTYPNTAKVVISNYVTNIAADAFKECTSITSVDIPNSVTDIGKEAFYHCASLASIYIPNSVATIGYGAFNKCNLLKSLKISYGVTRISEYAFQDCISLTNIEIPKSVEFIGSYAFSGCTALKSIEIHTLGNCAFYDCRSLESVKLTGYILSGIPENAFYNCKALNSINIPDSVSAIGDFAFSGCISLDIEIPDSVTSINRYAFKNVPHITYTGTASGSPWEAKSIN